MKNTQTRCAEQFARLEIAAEEYSISVDDFAYGSDTVCEVDLVRRGQRPLTFQTVMRIREFYPRINPIWLLEGRVTQ